MDGLALFWWNVQQILKKPSSQDVFENLYVIFCIDSVFPDV